MKYAAFVLLLVAACATPAPVCPAAPIVTTVQTHYEVLERRIDLLIA